MQTTTGSVEISFRVPAVQAAAVQKIIHDLLALLNQVEAEDRLYRVDFGSDG